MPDLEKVQIQELQKKSMRLMSHRLESAVLAAQEAQRTVEHCEQSLKYAQELLTIAQANLEKARASYDARARGIATRTARYAGVTGA